MSEQHVPGYWMNETSGQLRPVIENYLTGGRMSARDIAVMRNYLGDARERLGVPLAVQTGIAESRDDG